MQEKIEEELTLEYFFFRLPIYKPIEITNDNWSTFLEIIMVGNLGRTHGMEASIEGYNPFQGVDSTFTGRSSVRSGINYGKDGGVDMISIRCKRYEDEFEYFIHFDPDKKLLTKVGQHPSVADFHHHKIKKYRKVLSKEKLREFNTALGGAANGVGIGSFVYLRRIFESLIVEAKVEAVAAKVIEEKTYKETFGMDDRIKLLKDFLPEFLVEHRSIYSILSLGVHELDEKSCLEYFDPVRVGIEIILDEKLEIISKEEKIAEAKAKLASVSGELASKKHA